MLENSRVIPKEKCRRSLVTQVVYNALMSSLACI